MELEIESEEKKEPVEKTGSLGTDETQNMEASLASELSLEEAVSKTALQLEEEIVAATPKKEEKTAKGQFLGEFLIDKGIIERNQLDVALHEKQQSPDKMLGEIMVDLGFIDDSVLSSILATKAGYGVFDPSTVIDDDTLAYVSKNDANKYQVLPVFIDEEKGEAIIAMVDPYDIMTLDKLRRILPRGLNLQFQICSAGIISEAIDTAYGYASSVEGILKELAGDTGNIDLDEVLEEASYSHPIVRLVNALVFNGVKLGASDLHFEPEENFVRVRYRIDGVLQSNYILHKEYWNAIGQRLKILSSMNIADKLTPQDGRFNINVGGREADLRVSCLPTVHGENLVLRILDKSSGIVPLENLGFSEHNQKLIERATSRPEGIIIVTGPTGSGKTTTLYSMLSSINTVDRNIMTLEDPVEYSLPMIRQTNVREGGGLNFGDGVKALLRQDPDIIFVGEVRDGVTAEQALKAAMTGHQVYTSLHTNDSFGAIPRLLDLGLKPGMIAGSIIACFAQRLVRVLCPHCKEVAPATAEECRMLNVNSSNPPMIYHPKGCSKCNDFGYKGRVAIVEILTFDEDLDDIVAESGHKSRLKACAKEKGFKSMLDDGVLKVLEGVTSLDSLRKVVDFSTRL